jgi:hypothetical protein
MSAKALAALSTMQKQSSRAMQKAPLGAFPVRFISDVHEDATPAKLALHPALVLLPYQVSTISLFEVYRMGVPIFAPSLSLLKRWCQDYDLMWEATYGWPKRQEDLLGVTHMPDPNGPQSGEETAEAWEARFDAWMPLADWYQWEHVQLFNSWDDLMQKLLSTDLAAVSAKMLEVNVRERAKLVRQWKEILEGVRGTSV